MSRALSQVPGQSAQTRNYANSPGKETGAGRPSGMGSRVARLVLLAFVSALAATLHPFGFSSLPAGAAGLCAGAAFLALEFLSARVQAGRLIGAAVGMLAGLSASVLILAVVMRGMKSSSTTHFLEWSTLSGFVYLGLSLGGGIGNKILAGEPPESTAFGAVRAAGTTEKLLDTSVLIDGRIADICETHFLDGPLLVPQFVLKELQLVADASDALKRQRGRRGLEVLQQMQKLDYLQIRILEDDVAPNADVDQKLIELALRLKAKIVTNDFNLNKVASVQGIGVLNVNELANALRPAVLPGEAMRVFILREGKEANQGVAYLEDGTMVVVDGARRLINRTVDILVTSVHQTPAGKMIFGRLDERSELNGSAARHAAPGGDRGARAGFSSGDG